MKYLKPYKIFEADAPLQPGKLSWTKDLTIPRDMQMDLHDMSFELRDEGYEVSYQWWPPYEKSTLLYKDNKYPCINISKRTIIHDGNRRYSNGVEESHYQLEKIYWPWIEDFCQRVASYLDEKDYNVVIKYKKENSRDYIHIKDSVMGWGPFGDKPMANSTHFKIEMISREAYGDVNESVHDTRDEIEEVISTCKDILLEASHTFVGDSHVSKRWSDSKVLIDCSYTIPTISLRKSDELQNTMSDVHERLLQYMTSVGYSVEFRGEGFTKYVDMILNNITYNITFTKELDKEFIGHLRYLKKYNLLESTEHDNILIDIEDILLEFSDTGYNIKVNWLDPRYELK